MTTDKGTYEVDLSSYPSASDRTRNSDNLNLNLLQRGNSRQSKNGNGNSDIYAAGDCATVYHKVLKTSFAPMGTNASKQGIIGENLAGKDMEFPESSVLRPSLYEFGSRQDPESLEKLPTTVWKSKPASHCKQSRFHYPDPKPIKSKWSTTKTKRSGACLGGGSGAALRKHLCDRCRINRRSSRLYGLCYAPHFAPLWDPILRSGKRKRLNAKTKKHHSKRRRKRSLSSAFVVARCLFVNSIRLQNILDEDDSVCRLVYAKVGPNRSHDRLRLFSLGQNHHNLFLRLDFHGEYFARFVNSGTSPVKNRPACRSRRSPLSLLLLCPYRRRQ